MKINDWSRRNLEIDESLINNLNAENTINYIIDQINKVFENDASQKKFILNINQTLNKMIDTFEKIKMKKIINNERKIRELIQQSWAIIFFIRQQNSHNFILTAVMHDKIERIQRMTNDMFEESRSSIKKLTKKKQHAIFSWTACYKNECQTHFSKKKNRADIQKNRDDKKKFSFNDNERIIEMQFHSL